MRVCDTCKQQADLLELEKRCCDLQNVDEGCKLVLESKGKNKTNDCFDLVIPWTDSDSDSVYYGNSTDMFGCGSCDFNSITGRKERREYARLVSDGYRQRCECKPKMTIKANTVPEHRQNIESYS